MKKRLIAAILSLMLVICSCASGNEGTANIEKTQETLAEEVDKSLDGQAVASVCAVWDDFLDASQIKSQTEVWGLEYIKEYCASPSAVGLQRAISATEAVVATLCVLELPECELSSEALSSLADSGVDMSFVPLEYEALRRSIDEANEAWESMLLSLFTESFWEYGIEYIDGWADVRLESDRLHSAFSGKMTNAVALSLKIAKEDSIWQSWFEKAPSLFDDDFVWQDDAELLASEMSDILDCLEELNVTSAELNGVLGANYTTFEAASDTGDWSMINSVAVDFADDFSPVPLPEWDVTRVYSYRYDDETGDVVWTAVGDDLTVCPDGFVFQYKGIAFEEFNSYVDFLASLGVMYYPDGSTTEGESISLLYLEYCTMSLKWNNDLASIYFYDNEPLLTPSWYIGYLLGILN